ncbi:MAG: peptidylprolyl isomerase [Planctomycetaceae bacterium]|nr:peptidylprolyl isomerase [Planctomycetaceae bacterium]
MMKPRVLINLNLSLIFAVGLMGFIGSTVVLAQNSRPLVKVNGKPITEQDLQVQFLTRNIPPEQQTLLREQFLNDLIDQRLMQGYLQEEKVRVNKARVEESLAQVYQIIREANRDPQEVLQRLGLSEQMLLEELKLPLAWQVHLEEKVPPEKLRQFFDSRRQQFDGTKMHLRQIFLKVENQEQEEIALNQLSQIKTGIEKGEIAFEEAARKYSQAPTANKGGDLGFVSYRGEMPISITGPAFELKQGELSVPFLSPFGAHLIQVVEIQSGDLSLEDVRNEVWNEMSEMVWNNIVSSRRKSANIEWLTSPQ